MQALFKTCLLASVLIAFLSPASHAAGYRKTLGFGPDGRCNVITMYEGIQNTNAGFGMVSTSVSYEVGRRACALDPNDRRTCAQIRAADEAYMISMRSLTTYNEGYMKFIDEQMLRNREQYQMKNCANETQQAPAQAPAGTIKDSAGAGEAGR